MRSLNKKEVILVGKIIGVHGVKGSVKVLSYREFDLTDLRALFVNRMQKSFAVKGIRRHKGIFIIELEGYTDRNSSELLVGSEVSITKDQLPGLSEDEYYLHDLEGLDVWADDGRRLGSITNVFSTGSNDVIEVKGPFGEVLLPSITEVIKEVDLKGRRLVVHLLEGLLTEKKEK